LLNYVILGKPDIIRSENKMPILDIEIVAPDSTPVLPANLTQSLADEAAQVFSAQAGTVWVKTRIIPLAHYAENNETPAGTYPVFVTVLKSRARAERSRNIQEGSELKNEIARLTQVIAKVLNRPETNVHIFYQPDGAGRVAFGGKLVE
jgi:phenylpyruvate tautomerase PptA (4-oxalocrotonate tautomerase family)